MQISLETKVARALGLVRAGSNPNSAWLEMLAEIYPPEKLKGQVKHSCPKWAFSSLCHSGSIRGVAAGCCPESDGKNSARLALNILNQLRTTPSLSTNKAELKRRVFGEKGMPGYRKPNDEVEVILCLWKELNP